MKILINEFREMIKQIIEQEIEKKKASDEDEKGSELNVDIDNNPFEDNENEDEEKLSEMKVNKSKVDKTYKSVLNHMRKVIKKLNDDELYEVTTQLKKWFNKNIY